MELTRDVWQSGGRNISPADLVKLEAIFARCARTAGGCLIWGGCTNKKTGYSRIGYRGDVHLGHRLVFELAVRPLEPGEHVDHRCHNEDLTCTGGPSCDHRPCLEPNHLEGVTQAENNRRALEHARNTPGTRVTGEMRGTCKSGLHPWIPANVRWNGQQYLCVPCARERQRAYDRRVAEREGRVIKDRPASRKS